MTSTLTYGVRAPAAAFSLVRAQRRGEPLGRARALSGIKTPARFSSGRAKRHSLGARTVATAVTEPSSEAARVEEVKLSSSVLPGTAPSNGNPDDRTFVAKGARDVTFFRAKRRHPKVVARKRVDRRPVRVFPTVTARALPHPASSQRRTPRRDYTRRLHGTGEREGRRSEGRREIKYINSVRASVTTYVKRVEANPSVSADPCPRMPAEA